MKIVIIDDQKAMHLIMKSMLAKIDEVEIVGCFQETNSAFSFLMNNKVDLVFVDINMPKESGLDFAKRLRENGSQIKLVFVTSHKEYALSAFDVYAFDYIVKPLSLERLRVTILRALPAKKANSKTSTRSVSTLIDSLTKREIEVLNLMGFGLSNREIAAQLELTEGTVKNHIVNLFGKLQVKNRVQAITAAKEFELIE
jgi:DNA-binding NarL/FixJ family response regulator